MIICVKMTRRGNSVATAGDMSQSEGNNGEGSENAIVGVDFPPPLSEFKTARFAPNIQCAMKAVVIYVPPRKILRFAKREPMALLSITFGHPSQNSKTNAQLE